MTRPRRLPSSPAFTTNPSQSPSGISLAGNLEAAREVPRQHKDVRNISFERSSRRSGVSRGRARVRWSAAFRRRSGGPHRCPSLTVADGAMKEPNNLRIRWD